MYLFLLAALLGCPKTTVPEPDMIRGNVSELSEDDPIGTEEAFSVILIRASSLPLDFEDVLNIEDLRELYGDPGELSPNDWFDRLTPHGQTVYLNMLMIARKCDEIRFTHSSRFCAFWVQRERGDLDKLMRHAPHIHPDVWSKVAEQVVIIPWSNISGAAEYDSTMSQDDFTLMTTIIYVMHPPYEPSRYTGEPIGSWSD